MTIKTVKQEPGNVTAPVVIEQVYAEKPGGGMLENQAYDVKQGTAVYQKANSNLFAPIKSYKLYAAVTSDDTTIKIEKGSGIAVGDVIGKAKKAVASTAVDTSNAAYDEVTVTMGVSIAKGTILYQAASASSNAASPVGTPVYVVGNDVPANNGDKPVRLINGANLRKETAPIAAEVVALIPTINLV